MKRHVTLLALTVGFTALGTACASKVIGPRTTGDSGSSIVSSISGDEKDIKELSDNFKDFASSLTCEGGQSWEATSVKLAGKSLDIVFKVKAELEGKECQVDLRGNKVEGKDVKWTSPDSKVGLLYVSTKEKVEKGSLKVSFYKTFIVTEPGKKYRAVKLSAKFSAKYLATGAEKAVLKNVNLACTGRADVPAKLATEVSFGKDVKDAKADIDFPQVEVGKLEGCVFKALFDERTELSTDAMVLTISEGKEPQAIEADFKNVATLKDVKVDGTLNNQQLKDLIVAKDLIVTKAEAISPKPANNATLVHTIEMNVKSPKAGKCQIKAQGYDENDAASVVMSQEFTFEPNTDIYVNLFSRVKPEEFVAQKRYSISAKCANDSAWQVIKDISAIAPAP